MEGIASVSGRGVAHCSACSSFPSLQTSRLSTHGRCHTVSGVRIVPASSQPTTLEQPLFVSHKSSLWGSSPVQFFSSFGGLPMPQFERRVKEKEVQNVKRCGIARSYMETNNPVLKFFNRVQGALPIVGLITRLASGVGGVGTDRIRFEEFCTRVGRNCSREDTRAFYALSARYGKSAKPQFMLIWCWAAAVGAGLLRSENLLLGASRLRISCDLQYEVENFDLLMDEAMQRREKSGSKVPEVPMEFRVEKALEAMCKCCTGSTSVLEEDAPLYVTILKAVFPTVEKEQVEDIVAARLFDPSTLGGEASAPGDAKTASDVSLSSSQTEAEINAVVTSQMLDPLNDDDLGNDDQEMDDEESQSSVQDSPRSMAKELIQ